MSNFNSISIFEDISVTTLLFEDRFRNLMTPVYVCMVWYRTMQKKRHAKFCEWGHAILWYLSNEQFKLR